MNLLILPNHIGGETQIWNFKTKNVQCNEIQAVIMPGDAILSEYLEYPSICKNNKQLKQWLIANPEVSQWVPNKEKIIKIKRTNEHFYYWSVASEIWEYWMLLLGKEYKHLPILPDWMLLPKPKFAKTFAIKTNSNIIFRHENNCGGAISKKMSSIVEEIQPYWLGFPNSDAFYKLSLTHIKNQIRNEGMSFYVLSKMIRIFNQSLLPILIVSGAIMVIFVGENLLLRNQIPPVPQLIVNKIERSLPNGLNQSLKQLQNVQQQGPIYLEELSLRHDNFKLTLKTELPCIIMKERLSKFPLESTFFSEQENCRIYLSGELK